MNITDKQQREKTLRRLQRSIAVAIYPPFGATEVSELDAEFQRGLEAAWEVAELIHRRRNE